MLQNEERTSLSNLEDRAEGLRSSVELLPGERPIWREEGAIADCERRPGARTIGRWESGAVKDALVDNVHAIVVIGCPVDMRSSR